MKYVDEFRDKNLIRKAIHKINAIAPKERINLMEVCGTHTQSFLRFGLHKLLPGNLRLIAGPGCPVCVSTQEYIDSATEIAEDRNVNLLTFGDMLRVPGSKSSLEDQRAKGANVSVVYSARDAVTLAKNNPDKRFVFLAVGFETTIPTIALSIVAAKKEKLKNIYFLPALKLIPPAMDYLARDKRLNLSGFLCPGHVSTIIGTTPYEFIVKKYRLNCVIAGFEPLDILEGIYLLVRQIVWQNPAVINQYTRLVRKQGNPKAKRIISRVFKVTDAYWRGLGKIPESGLAIKEEFSNLNAEKVFSIKPANRPTGQPTNKCKCADVLKGLIYPLGCPLFAKVCRPDNPQGPCMVSSEGACSAYYRYDKR